ncbi:hypothetical protein QBC35DRAFT_535814 [Podospora australis]|uniref:Uncharacterized protein n=1 Tax=Podospora australis TaxID=1536484 RepID=A0AAN6WJM6_9PEZI|nr:hypothetical protein QBC35DRAFT_535814 [Podospora australis]
MCPVVRLVTARSPHDIDDMGRPVFRTWKEKGSGDHSLKPDDGVEAASIRKQGSHGVDASTYRSSIFSSDQPKAGRPVCIMSEQSSTEEELQPPTALTSALQSSALLNEFPLEVVRRIGDILVHDLTGTSLIDLLSFTRTCRAIYNILKETLGKALVRRHPYILPWACEHGHRAAVKWFLDLGVPPNNNVHIAGVPRNLMRSASGRRLTPAQTFSIYSRRQVEVPHIPAILADRPTWDELFRIATEVTPLQGALARGDVYLVGMLLAAGARRVNDSNPLPGRYWLAYGGLIFAGKASDVGAPSDNSDPVYTDVAAATASKWPSLLGTVHHAYCEQEQEKDGLVWCRLDMWARNIRG